MTIIKKFQPYDFDICVLEDECGIREPQCWQVANFEDPVGIQFDEPDSLLGAAVIRETFPGALGVFANVGAVGNNWSGATNEACVSANSKYLQTNITINTCECYKLVFDLKDLLESGCTLYFYGYDGATYTVLGSWTNQAAEDDIELCFCATEDYTAVAFQLTGTCDGNKCIDNVRLFPFDPTVRVETCDGDVIANILECDINLYCDHWDVVIDRWDDYITEDGCYRVCIRNAEFIANGSFENKLLGWEEGTDGDVAWDTFPAAVPLGCVNAAEASLVFGQESNTLTQDVSLPPNCNYTLNFTFNGGASAQCDLELYVNGVLENTWSIAGATTTFSYILSPVLEIESIAFKVTDTRGAGGAVAYQLCGVSIQQNICSKCFCVDNHECTLLLTGTQDEDARDFMYDDDFKFWMRIRAELLNSQPVYDDVVSRKSNGHFNLLYGDIVSKEDMEVYLQPRYIWNALHRIMINNNFFIDGVEYVKKEGDPEERWEDNFATGTIEVFKKKQHQRN